MLGCHWQRLVGSDGHGTNKHNAKAVLLCSLQRCVAAVAGQSHPEGGSTLEESAAGPFCRGAPALAGAALVGSAAAAAATAALAGCGAVAVADTSMRISGGCPVFIVRSASSKETNLQGEPR